MNNKLGHRAQVHSKRVVFSMINATLLQQGCGLLLKKAFHTASLLRGCRISAAQARFLLCAARQMCRKAGDGVAVGISKIINNNPQ